MFRIGFFALVVLAALGLPSPALAQSTVYIPAILELSGAGAVSGTNFRDGMLLAIDEINAKGGILGSKIDAPLLDTQSEASTSRAQVQKVLDNKPYVILGSGLLRLRAGGHATHATSGNPRDCRRRSRGDNPEGQSLCVPHFIRPAI